MFFTVFLFPTKNGSFFSARTTLLELVCIVFPGVKRRERPNPGRPAQFLGSSGHANFITCLLLQTIFVLVRFRSGLSRRREERCLCDICGSVLFSPNLLAVHMRIHTGQNTWKCEECNREFAGLRALAEHKFNHPGERPFTCDLCGASVAASDLPYHQALCDGSKRPSYVVVTQVCCRSHLFKAQCVGRYLCQRKFDPFIGVTWRYFGFSSLQNEQTANGWSNY